MCDQNTVTSLERDLATQGERIRILETRNQELSTLIQAMQHSAALDNASIKALSEELAIAQGQNVKHQILEQRLYNEIVAVKERYGDKSPLFLVTSAQVIAVPALA